MENQPSQAEPETQEETPEAEGSDARASLTGALAELESERKANLSLREQVVDSMQGEIEARRKLEFVRDYAARLERELRDFERSGLSPESSAASSEAPKE